MSEKPTNYRDLVAWQKAMALAEAIYQCSAAFPRAEMFGMVAQLRRAAISVPANIAEGQGRRNTREFAQYLRVAHGSLRELETYVILAGRLGYLGDHDGQRLLDLSSEVGRVVIGLGRSLPGAQFDVRTS